MATFHLMPAIDLRGGRVVRLLRGDFGRETAYSDDPVAVATAFVDGGARWLHVVDLDGARAGHPVQSPIIDRIVAAVGSRTSVEVAGGLRTPDAVAEVLDHGASRAVLGTAALADPRFPARLVAAHGQDRIAVSLDVRDGFAVGDGWAAGAAGTPIQEALAGLVATGVRWIEVTSIDRDGTLGGPDLELLRRVGAESAFTTIAAGGISSVDDLRAVRSMGCAGAIVGRALYDGTLRLGDALAVPVE